MLSLLALGLLATTTTCTTVPVADIGSFDGKAVKSVFQREVDDELPPWADKLVDKIVQALGDRCAASASSWSASAGNDDGSSSGIPASGPPAANGPSGGSTGDANGAYDSSSCSEGYCGDNNDADTAESWNGHQYQQPPPYNPHQGNDNVGSGSAIDQGSQWSAQQLSTTAHWPKPWTSTSTATFSTVSTPTPKPTDPWPDHVVTGYYGVGQSKGYPLSEVAWEYLTHLCYAFAKTTADYSLDIDSTLLSALSSEARAHGVKPVLSIGGYGNGGGYFSVSIANNASRSKFVRTIKEAVDEYQLAGVDIDWEFVGALATYDDWEGPDDDPVNDAANYLEFLKALRAAVGADIEISAAVPMYTFTAGKSREEEVDMTPYVPYFDRIYLMAYDLWSTNTVAGSNAALERLQSPPAHKGQKFGSDGVAAWSKYFPPEKLVLGVPFYGYGYKLLANSNPEVDGLYVPVGNRTSGDNGESPTSDQGFWRWRNLKSQGVLVQNGTDGSYDAGEGWVLGWDESTQTPYVFTDDRLSSSGNGTVLQDTTVAGGSYGEIISFDDPASLRLKRDYAQEQGLGGMMFWIASADTSDGELAAVLA
ncbi:Endochitinase [Cyphellophora attinorum]|uniref:chitinase n=1 Tax=Cyphellophora attinorum TaxID=1664694 RepID=A0A0N0NMS7_9EURO|nr:Endochitinase [Phialophora attinorum]KPI40698.1 Endochitinase [Phialophora attinorum]